MALLRKSIKETVWDYLVLFLGTIIYCIAWESFLIPNDIASGGLTGACTIIQIATGGAIPVSTSFFVLNTLLLLIAFLVLGKGFGIRSVFCILLSSLIFKVMPSFEWLKCVEGQFLYLGNKFVVALIGGLLESVGVGIILSRDGSTGGSDIVAMMLNKFWPISPGKFYLFSDLFIIATILLVPGRTFQDMVFGYVAMITFSFMVDFVLLGRKSTAQVLIFSEKYTEIADYIINVLDRGVTAINCIGWYTQKDRKVLLIIIRKYQIHDMTKVIKQIDPNAFMSVAPASSVFGEGFEEIKTGMSDLKNVVPGVKQGESRG
ncbi:MAG: YitT family protein [Bacteroidales bacterium]|nr:YitT family protein [Bacteroidales bacterium]